MKRRGFLASLAVLCAGCESSSKPARPVVGDSADNILTSTEKTDLDSAVKAGMALKNTADAQLFDKLDAAYKTARSIEIHGIIQDAKPGPTLAPLEDKKSYDFWYRAPDRYRLEIRENKIEGEGQQLTNAAWTDPTTGAASSWNRYTKIKAGKDIQPFESIAVYLGRTGVMVPRAILRNPYLQIFTKFITGAKVFGEETIDNVVCLRIDARMGASDISLWVEKMIGIAKKIEVRNVGPAFTLKWAEASVLTSVYNAEIPDDAFAFIPPA